MIPPKLLSRGLNRATKEDFLALKNPTQEAAALTGQAGISHSVTQRSRRWAELLEEAGQSPYAVGARLSASSATKYIPRFWERVSAPGQKGLDPLDGVLLKYQGSTRGTPDVCRGEYAVSAVKYTPAELAP